MASRPLFNAPAPNVPYFVPRQYPPAGTAFDPQPDGKPIPTLFKPLKIRGVEFQNRVFLAPLGQYSSENGVISPWQLVHLGGILTHGPGLTFTEATAILPEGRATPSDAGIWTDEQAAAWAHVVQFAHSQNQKIGIQLAHAGRKASSTVAPWVAASGTVPAAAGGWPDDVWGPTDEPFQADYPTPKALTRDGIARLVQGFADAAKRAVRAGFDVIELHGAHGFLISSFYAPSNTRTDEYGGAFEHRIRLAVELVDAVRSVVPPAMPLFFRVSATDWLEDGHGEGPRWRLEDTVCLSRVLAEHGVDFIDVSSGGLSSSARVVPLEYGPGYQVPFAAAVKAALGDKVFVGAVGAINEGRLAQSILDEGKADVVLVGRMFQKNPGFVWKLADDLGVELHQSVQIGWPFQGRVTKVDKKD